MNAAPLRLQPAQRIAAFRPYFFAELNQRIQRLRAQGMSIIRLDAGSPDLPPPEPVIQRLIESARRSDTHGYSAHGGTPAFRQAAAAYYLRRFGVQLDPHSQTLGLLGSKEGIFHLTQALIDPGDLVLIPDPGYPVYSAAARIAAAQAHFLPLRAENGWLPRLDDIPQEIARRAKLLWLNYPNNPTGATAAMDFFEQAAAFARRWNILIAHDAPYVDVCYDGYRAPSILQVKDACSVAVEFSSLSKTANMAGWRAGIAAGSAEALRLLSLYKSQVDSGGFLPIEEAAAAALLQTENDGWLEARNRVYQRRRDLILGVLNECGFTVDPPRAALYLWARLPNGWQDDLDFCARLLEARGVSVTPGSVYGENGRGYVRFSLCAPLDAAEDAMARLKDFLAQEDKSSDKNS